MPTATIGNKDNKVEALYVKRLYCDHINAIPVGAEVMWSSDKTPPVGFLKENGASISRTMYPQLFEVFGTIYGAVDSSHFNLPNVEGRIVRAFDDVDNSVTELQIQEVVTELNNKVNKNELPPYIFEKDNIIYGFRVDNTEADPSASVIYLADAKGMTPARMDYQSNIFDYGSWENAFFMPKPCMLKYDGTVDYYLDKNNYAFREDGVTPSDVANDSYGGNAMMEWGQNGKKIYYKVVNIRDGCYEVYIANYKADGDFVCYSFIGGSNQELDHFYTPIYNGSNVSSRLRSLSGKTHMVSQAGTTEISYAQANGSGWYIEQWCDRVLINFLLILMGKSLDTQKTFGNGHYSGGSSASSNLPTGRLNGKGLFWGTNGNDSVKVFGMENYWAEVWRRTAGLINDKGTYKVKMTAGNYDGSTAIAYNTDGTGYIPCGTAPSASASYISRMHASKYGLLPSVVSGSASTYYCDAEWTNNGQINYARVGGRSYDGSCCGFSAVYLNVAVSDAGWSIGAALSFKHS